MLSGHRVQDQEGGAGEEQQQQRHGRGSHVPSAGFSHAPRRLTQRGGTG